MPNKKISELPTATTLQNGDLFLINNSGTTSTANFETVTNGISSIIAPAISQNVTNNISKNLFNINPPIEEGSILQYSNGIWRPYKMLSLGLGKEVYSNSPIDFNTTVNSSTATSIVGTILSPMVITGIIPWKKLNKVSEDARNNSAHLDWNIPFTNPLLYREMNFETTGVLSWNGTINTSNATKEMRYVPTISIQGVRADGTIRGRLGNVRVVGTNNVTGIQIGTGTVNPNTGMVTDATTVLPQDGSPADIMNVPACNTNYAQFPSVEGDSLQINNPQDVGTVITKSGVMRKLHPEAGGNEHTGGTWAGGSEDNFKYGAPWYPVPLWSITKDNRNFGIQISIKLFYKNSYGWFSDTIYKKYGTVVHSFNYEIKTVKWGPSPGIVTTTGELHVLDDVFNPNVSYNISFYPPKQISTDMQSSDIISRIFEGRIQLTY